jgi:hypothetical protein
MPSAANSFPHLEPSNALTYSDDVSNCLMAGYTREDITEIALLHESIRVTDTAGDNLNKDVAWSGLFQLDICDRQFGALVVEEQGLVSLG